MNIQLQSGFAQTFTEACWDMSRAADVAISDVTTSQVAPERPINNAYPSEPRVSRRATGARLISVSSRSRMVGLSGRPAM